MTPRLLLLTLLLATWAATPPASKKPVTAASTKPVPRTVRTPAPRPLTPISKISTAAHLDEAVSEAIREHKIPGAVLLIGHKGTIVQRKAYGFRDRAAKEPMTLDTIFDAASL